MSLTERVSFFAALGRFSVRFRWLVIAFWVLAAVAALALLPSLGSVVKNNNAGFLPDSAPSVRAQAMAAPLLGRSSASGVLVAVGRSGPLSLADQAVINRIEAEWRQVPQVTSVRQGPASADGEVRTAEVHFTSEAAGGGPLAAKAVGRLRSQAHRLAPADLSVYLSGSLPVLVDQQHAGASTANRVELFSVVLIILVLLLAFRSTLAPLVNLAPAGLALAVASPIIAESTKVGVEISSLLQLLLTALVLGAGTDYGLFLIFRYRENLRRGLGNREAIVAAVERVGVSVAFSAATVIAALLTLLLASFGLYRGVGPGLAIGIAVVLLVELTFFPALLAVLGKAVFWPATPRPAPPRPGRWGALAARVSGRPVLAVVLGTVMLGALALGLGSYAPSGFNPGGAIGGSGSARGLSVLEAHFGPAALGVTDVVYRLSSPIWEHPGDLAAGSESLRASGQFSSVDDALQASGVPLAPHLLAQAYRRLGPPQRLAASPAAAAGVDPALYNAYRSTAQFITADGRTVVYRTSLRAGGPGSTAALQAIPAVRAAVANTGVVLGATASGVAGQAAAAADVAAYSSQDIWRIAPLVLAILALLLGLVLRSALAPLYLVASVALSYLASLGLAVMLFVGIGGQLGINFTLPFFMFVFIMALGEDYNILVMTRIREEASGLALRQAVATALGTTGTTVTSAGLVLAGTFGVLAAFTSGQVQQVAVGLALGIVLDTFVVRTLVVPSAAVLLGRWNWWPGSPPGSAGSGATRPGAPARTSDPPSRLAPGTRAPGDPVDPTRRAAGPRQGP